MSVYGTEDQGQPFHDDDAPHTEQAAALSHPSLAQCSLPCGLLKQETAFPIHHMGTVFRRRSHYLLFAVISSSAAEG